MEIRGATEWDAGVIARSLGMRLDNVRHRNNGFAAVLRPESRSNAYRRIGHSGRRITAICYHGHYAWMEALLKAHPDATIRTSMATYHGLDDFYRMSDVPRYQNIGSRMQPLQYEDACTCGLPSEYPGAIEDVS